MVLKLPPQGDALAADALVTAFDPIPSPKDLPDSVGDHLWRIHSALKAVSEQKYPQALAAVKSHYCPRCGANLLPLVHIRQAAQQAIEEGPAIFKTLPGQRHAARC